MPEALPQLLRHVRRVRLDHRHRSLCGEARGRILGPGARQLVHELDHRGDRGVERLSPADVVRDARDRLVRLAGELVHGHVAITVAGRHTCSNLGHEPVQAPHEAHHAFDAFVGPVHVLIRGTDEQDVQTNGVRAVLLEQEIRTDHVALRLRHLRPIKLHPAVREEAHEGLAEADVAEVVQRLHEEARIDQVHRGVVDAADVLVDRAPPVDELPVPRSIVVPRVAVAQEVPGRIDEGVHRLDLAASLPAADGARRAHPVLRERERRDPPRLVVVDLGQEHRQLAFGNRDGPVLVAVDDRDRAAPVALSREAPVAEAEADRLLATTTTGEPLDDCALALVGRQ